MLQFLRWVAMAFLSLLVPCVQATAEHYPDRVVRIINPYPPGGSVDVMARILAQKLTEAVGQQVIVENRSGGGGNTGSDFVAKAEPRRLHAPVHRARTAHRQPDPLQQTSLRPGEGLCADR